MAQDRLLVVLLVALLLFAEEEEEKKDDYEFYYPTLFIGCLNVRHWAETTDAVRRC